uniref:Uncharacterized protein n=1 Tax=Rhizophora mucronata TaxID=61149 RepID=A0A2P2IHI1_RHIMU
MIIRNTIIASTYRLNAKENKLKKKMNGQAVQTIIQRRRQFTKNRKFGRKNEVSTIFVSSNMLNDLIMSSRT